MRRFDWTKLSADERQSALARPKSRDDALLLETVRAIVEDVRARGWPALCHFSKWLDDFEPELVAVAPYAAEARRSLGPGVIEAMELAARNIRAFHEATRPCDICVETMPGVMVSKQWRPTNRVGLYVPGGKAPLFSTLMMLALPARAAGVCDFLVATPPRPNGGLDLGLALAAELCGIEQIWTMGGAQAIAAMAFGAGDIRPVDLVCGPGNSWVSAAKSLVASINGGPGIDLPAGPSELMIIADDSAKVALVAADMLAQAEHDAAAQVILVSPSPALIDGVTRELIGQAAAMGGSYAPARALFCRDLDEAVTIANAYAPEHLSLAVQNPTPVLEQITNAGAVFLGAGAAESFGDYCAGSSHVLPTDGAARFTGGVTTATFMKAMSVQQLSSAAAKALAKPAALLARLEGLEAHARAAEARA